MYIYKSQKFLLFTCLAIMELEVNTSSIFESPDKIDLKDN